MYVYLEVGGGVVFLSAQWASSSLRCSLGSSSRTRFHSKAEKLGQKMEFRLCITVQCKIIQVCRRFQRLKAWTLPS